MLLVRRNAPRPGTVLSMMLHTRGGRGQQRLPPPGAVVAILSIVNHLLPVVLLLDGILDEGIGHGGLQRLV